MRIIISPAKKMNRDTDSLPWRDLPAFLDRTGLILERMQSMPDEALQRLWKCNDQIAAVNIERIRSMDLRSQLTPAILAYEGIQYQYMSPGVFTEAEYEYVQAHLRILSGFYGVLRPFDGVVPYRLEMQAKLAMDGHKDLYGFWSNSIAEEAIGSAKCVINLASKEYSLCVSKHLPEDVRFVTCVFGEEKDGNIIEKGTMCKMARGEMVRFMAENKITDPEKIKKFDRLEHSFCAEKSDESNFVFVRKEKKKPR